jgi:ribose-phosphate pyrophosphokinase
MGNPIKKVCNQGFCGVLVGEIVKEIKFFYGTSNPELGKKICALLGCSEGKINLKKFSNGEIYAQFLENIRGKDVFLLQTAVNPINDCLVELLIMIDAAKRASAGRITVITPNYFYARQDRKAASREPITAKLVADLITTAGADRVITIDLHSDQTQGFFNIPLDNLPMGSRLIQKARELIGKEEAVVVAPDAGSAKKATKIASRMNLDLAIINKIRMKHNEAKALNIIGADITGKTCLIFDDMIDTGGTLCTAIDMLKENGAKKVYALITHGVLSKDAIEKIENSKIDKLIITDTLPIKRQSTKIEVITIADYLAESIKCINNEESVSILFHEQD